MLKRLLLSTILLLAVIAVMGQSVTIDKIKYEVISPTEAVLVDGYKAEGDVVVPEYVTIKDRQYRVIKIGDYAFKKQKKLDSKAENTNIKSIRLPNSIITIGWGAFDYCTTLTYVTMSNNLKNIDVGAFSNCISLIEITLPNCLTGLGYGAFFGCSLLKRIVVPDSVPTLDGPVYDVFGLCPNLTSIRGHNVECPTWIVDSLVSAPEWVDKNLTEWAKNAKKTERPQIQQQENSLAIHIKTATKNGKISKLPTIEEYVKPKVERDINEWQKKDEFESTAKWKARVNETTRNKKAKELAQKYKNEYVALQEKQKKEYEAVVQEFYAMKEEKQKVKFKADLLKLSTYDADNQSFMIKSGSEAFADILLPVKVEDAPSFKANWEKIKLTATLNYVPNGDDVALTAVTFKDGDKTYTYDSNTKAKYAVTEIDYNFKPIELAMTEGDNINYTFNPLEEMAQRVVTTPEQDLSKRQNGVTVEQKKLSVGGLADVDTDIPSGAQAANNTFAVIIGNENYSQVSKVPYALNDAKIFATYCQKTLGLPQKNIKTYTDATFGILLSAVDNIKKIAEAYKGNLNIIFYYAGHGLPNEDSKDAFLLPVDADGRNTAACYATNKLYEELAGLGAKSVTVFMDACFSGAQRGEGMLASARGVATKPRDVEPKGNMVVFSAASADETAYPYTEKGHGLFTYFLLKKLQESKGNATLGELGSYIREKVSQESIVTNGKSQTPTVVSSAALGDGWKNMRLK